MLKKLFHISILLKIISNPQLNITDIIPKTLQSKSRSGYDTLPAFAID